MSENRRYLYHVESMRAMAALVVAIFHFSQSFKWNELTTQAFALGAQGVEIFYLISGFIIPYSLYHSSYQIRDYFRYMGKRLIRLLPPYFVTIGLIHLVGILLCSFIWGCAYDINFRETVINMFFLADLFENYNWINPIFATLEVELQFYILIGLLFPLFNKHRWSIGVICVIILAIGRQTYDIDTVFMNAPFFIAGLSLFFIREEGWKTEFILPLGIALITLLSDYYWSDFGAAVIGCSFILFLPNKMKFLRFTGRISYSYYLVHGLSGGWFLYFALEANLFNRQPVLLIPLALLISWVCAFLLYFLFERPSMKISKRIRYQK